MREVSNAYKALRLLAGCHYEIQIIRGPISYGMDDILAAKLTQQLFASETGPAVGGVTASMVQITLFESGENWPRMASFELRVRLWDADETVSSEWLSFGTFWTDTREQSKNKVKLTITGYDGVLLLEQKWTDLIPEADLPENWPITSAAAAALLQQASGVQLEAGTVLDNTVSWFGLDTKQTVRRAWASIAAAEGKNIIMTPAGTLRMVPLVRSFPAAAAVAGTAVAGMTVIGVSESFGGDPAAGKTFVGLDMKSLRTSPDFAPVHSVQLQTMGGSIASAGSGGYTIKAPCEYSDSAAAGICLQNVDGYVYRPFEAESVRLDPAVELGDLAFIKDGWRQITMIEWRFASQIFADISAPAEREVDHEYTVESEAALAYRKAVQKAAEDLDEALDNYYTKTETQSYIQQNAESIVLGVTETRYYDRETIDMQNQQLSGGIQVEHDRITAALSEINTVDGEVSEIQSYIRYVTIDGVGTVVIGQTNSLSEFRVSNEQISAVYNNEIVSYWNQSKQFTPKQLQIPAGGSLRLGNILWQPRSSGNLSIFLTNS